MSQGIDMDAVIAELQKGWQQGSPEETTTTGPTCLLGALNRVADLAADWYEPEVAAVAIELFNPIIRAQFPERVAYEQDSELAWGFNDHEDTTLDDVILVCEKARAEQ